MSRFRALVNKISSWQIFGALVSWGLLMFLGALLAIYAVLAYYSRGLPDADSLVNHRPAVISRVYSAEGEILDEYAHERRIFTPFDQIPAHVKDAFISAEDKHFYTHPGFDVVGMGKALLDTVTTGNARGASTITQQVAKNLVLDGSRNIERKVRELLVSSRIESTLTKERILELYLNEIFLGQNAYGVTAAALTYFNKPLDELTIAEAAYLAALPKAPSTYHPVREYDRALTRRDYVLEEMFENGYISEEDHKKALKEKLKTVQAGDFESPKDTLPPRDYFTDEVRRQLIAELGKEELFSNGYNIRTTIDRDLQNKAREALREALEKFDRQQERFHGPIAQISPELLDDWEKAIDDTPFPRDIDGWHGAVVLAVADDSADIGVEFKSEAKLPLSSISWARYKNANGNFTKAQNMNDILSVGDVIYVKETEEGWSFRQIPLVSGAFTAIDPRNGRVLAIVGGFSYEHSNFNRATQAMRQPGSSIKPFVYASALDEGFGPNAIIVDAPISINTPQGVWRPQNASNKFYGPAPMITGLTYSRNLMTVRLAQEIGMEKVARLTERYGIYDEMQPVLANSLGSQETTVYRMVSAYSLFANGGKEIKPTVVDRVQDREGNNVILHDTRVCNACMGNRAAPETTPEVLSSEAQVMDAVTSAQVRVMLQSVVARGTASGSVGRLGLPIAGKTGTTNEAKDAWFIGFTPNIVAGCYIGFDDPKSLGRGASGGGLCGPVFSSFITEALKTHGGFNYPQPSNAEWVTLDISSGYRVASGGVSMPFKIGEAPVIGEGGRYIDGGFIMGEDLILYDNGEAPTTDEGAVGDIPVAPSVGTINSGGLY